MNHVFVGGCARSGTTLLGAILGTHSKCLATPESRFLLDIHRACALSSGGIDVGRFRDALGAHPLFRIWGVAPPIDLAVPANPEKQFAAAFERVIHEYAARVAKPFFDFWIDHTPSNVARSAILRRLFPGAKLIHVIRDGRAVASSVMKLDWGPSTIATAARWWTSHTAIGIAAESFFGPQASMRVKYELLVEHPRQTVNEILRFLGIDYEDGTVSGAGFVIPEYTAKQHELVGKAPNASRAHAWKVELTPREIEIFESVATDMLIGLGYTPNHGLAATPPSQIERLSSAITEMTRRRIINRWRYRRRLKKTVGATTLDGESR